MIAVLSQICLLFIFHHGKNYFIKFKKIMPDNKPACLAGSSLTGQITWGIAESEETFYKSN